MSCSGPGMPAATDGGREVATAGGCSPGGRVPGCGVKARPEKIEFPGRGLLNVIKALRRGRGFYQKWGALLLMRSVMVSFRDIETQQYWRPMA